LTGGLDHPQPDRPAGKIAIRSEFLGSLSAFQLGRLAVTADIRLAERQILISSITPVGYPLNLYRRLIVRL
jgi:hypothetical protein